MDFGAILLLILIVGIVFLTKKIGSKNKKWKQH